MLYKYSADTYNKERNHICDSFLFYGINRNKIIRNSYQWTDGILRLKWRYPYERDGRKKGKV